MHITLRQLTYFIALAEARHFGRAAASLHISQPALSVQIRELEDQFGAQLVERQSRGVVLTPAGHEVLQHARRIEADMQALKQSARWRAGLAGRLTLGVIPTVAPYLLPEALPMLRSRDLSLTLGVREAQTETLIDELVEGRLDAALMAIPNGRDDLVEVEVFRDRFLLAGSAAQLAALDADHVTVSPNSIDPGRLLLLDEGHCLADQALEVCAFRRSQTRVDLSAASLGTLCRLVADGFGLTFLPQIALATETRATPGLQVRAFADPQPARVLGLVRRRTSRDDGWFTDLAQVLRDALNRVSAEDGAMTAPGGSA